MKFPASNPRRPLYNRLRTRVYFTWAYFVDWLGWWFRRRDKCQFCLGAKRGVRGNENRFARKRGGYFIVCDYCTAMLIDMVPR